MRKTKGWALGFLWITTVLFLVSCQGTAKVSVEEEPETEVLETKASEAEVSGTKAFETKASEMKTSEAGQEEIGEFQEGYWFEGVKVGMAQTMVFSGKEPSEEPDGNLEAETFSESSADMTTGESPTGEAAPGEEGGKESSEKPPAQEETPPAPEPEPEQSRAAALKASAGVSQLILVEASGTQAAVTVHQKNGAGFWEEIYQTSGYVGWEGVGNTTEYTKVTPAGVYTLGPIFGCDPDPGCPRGYIQVDESYYWVDDVDSVYYNRMISTRTDGVDESDFNSAERLGLETVAYAYVAAIDYNTNCVPGAGSAIFLHVSEGRPTSGCISVPREAMVFILTHLASDTRIVIGNSSGAFALDQY